MSVKNKLSPRNENIFKILIEEHIRTAEPIGSRTISKLMVSSLSAASVRNVMQDLEEMGFLRHPHTSAGRVPTTMAFRYYISEIMRPKKLAKSERKKMENIFLSEFSDILQLLESLGIILAELTKELGLIISPRGEELVLHRIELIPLGSQKVVMVLVTKTGFTRSIVMEFKDMKTEKFDLLANILNERLSGLRFNEIKRTISERLADFDKFYGSFLNTLISSAEEIFKIEDEYPLLFGRENILGKPEFSDPEKLHQIMELSEKNDTLLKCVSSQDFEGDVEVLIGPPPVTELGLVLAKYTLGHGEGVIGVVGPTRMNYSKIVQIVSFAADKMAQIWKS